MDTRYSASEPLPLPYPAPHHHHQHQLFLRPHHHHHLFLCPHHHHHHHHHHMIVCTRHHNYLYPHPHRPGFDAFCKVHTPPLLQSHTSSVTNTCHQPSTSGTQTLLEPEHLGLEEEDEEEEEEEEPVFVLTDEWRDFFAKSEAKRKLEKQQEAKRKGRK